MAVADLDTERASTVAAAQGVESLTVDELLAHPDVDVVLNLTIPAAHVEIGTRALQAGKHVFAEKPLGLDPLRPLPCSTSRIGSASASQVPRIPCSERESRRPATPSTQAHR